MTTLTRSAASVPRRLGAGVIGGIVGGIVFGILMAMMDMLPLIAGLVSRLDDPPWQ